jgi:hypothetical protein
MIFKIDDRCKFCVHYSGNRTCKAFLEKIPDDFWSGKVVHDLPVEGDNGYLFELDVFGLVAL